VKGHLIGYQQPPGMYRTILRHGHTYLLQRAGGLLIVGSSEEHTGFDRSIDAGIVADLAARAAFLLPHLAKETPTEAWTGLRPASDALHTEAHGTSGRLYLAYGHYRNGILLAPVTARDLAAEISASFEKR
jgi:glycine oxidase